MSTQVLPSLAGLDITLTRAPVWDTTIQQAISGKETRIARQTYPRWQWELTYNVLRSSAAYTELQQIIGFFNSLSGQFDTFLFTDPDDNAVTAQGLGTGDGVTTVFPLVRSFGGFTEPVLAPNRGAGVAFQPYVNGVAVGGSNFSVGDWGSATPGLLTFTSGPPAVGVAVTCDFSFYWPCRMNADTLSVARMFSQMYECKKFTFISVKN